MKAMLASWKDPEIIIEEKGLKPVSSEQIHAWVKEVFAEKPDMLIELKAWNMKLMWFVTGQVMKKSAWAANPQLIQEQVQTFL
jgi:aspartyl-tRNA(Asn)/glutamyl-tRNA(Gln) amidotransferase subunit B